MLAALTPGCFISTHRAFPTTIPSSTGGGLLSEELKPRAGLIFSSALTFANQFISLTPPPLSTGGGLLSEELKPRAGLPPLLVNLAERPAERLHYLGVSFGLTQVGTKQSCNSLSQLW